MASTPAADGFHMPGEFEPHAGCWMIWPERPDNWREGARPAQRAFAAVAEAIAACEQVTVGVSDAHYERCREMLPPTIRVVELASDDAWMRDLGPSFLLDGRGARLAGRLALQRLGRPGRGPLRAMGPRRARGAQGA